MTVKVTKPAVNLREELASLNKPSGIVGESILRADTAADAVEQLNLEDHTFTTFTSTGIDDNTTSTKLTVSDTGIDVTGEITADGLKADSPLNTLSGLELTYLNATKAIFSLLPSTGEIRIGGTETNYFPTFYSSGGEALRITSAGNVGIGVVPPTDAHATWSQLFLGEKGSFISEKSNSGGIYGNYVTDNLYIDADTGSFANITTDESSAYSQEAGVHKFYSQASGSAGAAVTLSEKMTIDASGNVKINNGILQIERSGSSPLLQFTDTGVNSRWMGLVDGTSNFTIYGTDGTTQELTLDSSGNVGIGCIPSDYHTLASNLVVASAGDTGMTIVSGTGSDGRIFFADGTSGSAESEGQIRYNHADDSMHFVTSDSTAVSIDSSGNLFVGSDSAGAYPKNGHNIRGGDSAVFSRDSTGETMQVRRNTTDGNFIRFYKGVSTIVGDISLSGSSTAYNTSSDYRLKTDAQPMTGASARVQALNPVNFEWIASGDRVDGFLAHEAQAIVPECVTGTKDAMRDEEYEVTPAVYEDVVIEAVLDDEGNELEAERTEQQLVTEAVMGTRSVPDMQGIDQSKIVPLLTAALQEALTEITALKARVTALEG